MNGARFFFLQNQIIALVQRIAPGLVVVTVAVRSFAASLLAVHDSPGGQMIDGRMHDVVAIELVIHNERSSQETVEDELSAVRVLRIELIVVLAVLQIGLFLECAAHLSA